MVWMLRFSIKKWEGKKTDYLSEGIDLTTPMTPKAHPEHTTKAANEHIPFYEEQLIGSSELENSELKGILSNISIITVYAPTRVATDADKDSFYSNLEITMQKCPKRDFLILAGDWNSRVSPTDPNVRRIVGPFKYGMWCSNGDRLFQFMRSHDLFITNTMFQHKPSQKDNLALK
ncbi:hypothetical protein QYM36_005456 [Artemia franciscana]|uniref:Endonuclease/exonuclease/phosphatase domain-containing protein n=1 Tax=Artemia franciscana TaxID=6661 RepID=A0AA88HU85_ARTSF|nr:hypothetical protein QYM36_005456 [Artemia franciscana]